MTVTASTMLPLGTKAPAFSLPDTQGRIVSPEDFKEAPALVIIFMCNHCPFVKHVLHAMVELTGEYQQKGVAFVAINSNNAAEFPEDRPERMKELAAEAGFTFPYLYDETQEVAKEYRAACTPDFYVFDRERKLAYRGQMDASRPGSSIVPDGADLRAALDAVLENKPVGSDQKPSMGCNIKWKPGNEPRYAV